MLTCVAAILVVASYFYFRSNPATFEFDTFKSIENIIDSSKEQCVVYPSEENVIKFNLPTTPQRYCAVCGDDICDYSEKCLPSSPLTTDCGGGLFCPKDCEK